MVGGEPENPSPFEDDSANGGERVCGVGGKAAADAVAAAAAVASCILIALVILYSLLTLLFSIGYLLSSSHCL